MKESVLTETEYGWTFGVQYDENSISSEIDKILQDKECMETIQFQKQDHWIHDERGNWLYKTVCMKLKDGDRDLGDFKNFVMSKTAIATAKTQTPFILRRDCDSTTLKLCVNSKRSKNKVKVTEYENSYQAVNDYLNMFNDWLNKEGETVAEKDMMLKWATKEALCMLRYSYMPNGYLPSSAEVSYNPSAKKTQLAWFKEQKNKLPTERDDFKNWYAVKENAAKEGKVFFLDFERYQKILDIVEQTPGTKQGDELAQSVGDAYYLLDEVRAWEKANAGQNVKSPLFSTYEGRRYTADEIKAYVSLVNISDPTCTTKKSAADEMFKLATSQARISYMTFQKEESISKVRENIPNVKSDLLASAVSSRSKQKTYTVDRL